MCHLGPFGPQRRPGPCCDHPPPGLCPQGTGGGIAFIHFPRRPGVGGRGACRCGAEPMGVNLAAVRERERGGSAPRGAHRIGSGATVPEMQNGGVQRGLWTPDSSRTRCCSTRMQGLQGWVATWARDVLGRVVQRRRPRQRATPAPSSTRVRVVQGGGNGAFAKCENSNSDFDSCKPSLPESRRDWQSLAQ